MKTASEKGWGMALRFALIASLLFGMFTVGSAFEWTILYGDVETVDFLNYCASGCNTSTDAHENNNDGLWGASGANQFVTRYTASTEFPYAHFAIPFEGQCYCEQIHPESLTMELKAWSGSANNDWQTVEFSPDNNTWYEFDWNQTAQFKNVLDDSSLPATLTILDFINDSHFLNIYIRPNTTALSDGIFFSGFNITTETYNASERTFSNCTNTHHQKAFWFDTYDESAPTGMVNSTIDAIQFDFTLSNGTDRSVALVYGYNISHQVCLFPAEDNFTTNMHAQYVADDYSARHWYLTGARVQNITEVVNLFLINDTQDDQIAIQVRDESLNNKEGAEVRVLRWMPPAYTTSTILKTNAEGKAYVYLYKDEWYKFQVLYNGTLYKTTEPTQLVEYSTTSPYIIDVSFGDPTPYLTWIGGIGYTISREVTPTPTYYRLTVTDPSGLSAAAFVNITSINLTEPVAYCGSRGVGTSFTITCLTTDYPDGVYLINTWFIMDDNSFWLVDERVWQKGEPASQIPNDGLILSVILVGTIAFAGLIHPVLAIFMTIIGLVAVASLQLALISWESIIGIIFVGLIIMYIIGRGGQGK